MEKVLQITAHVLLLLLLQCAVLPAADRGRPNIVMFLIDDQNFEQIGAYGGKTYTPNLDRMAEEGLKFNRAYVSSTVCTPSRYSFLTGRYAGRSYSKCYQAVVGTDRQGFPSFNVALEADRMNVGNVLRQSGYVTGFVGKYHLCSELDHPGFYQGKDGFIEFDKNAEPGVKTSAVYRHNEQWGRRYLEALGFSWAKHIYEGNMMPPYSAHNPEWTLAAAFEFIEANKSRPFYLHYCTTLLHGPGGSWRKSMDQPQYSGEGEIEPSPEVIAARKKLLSALRANGFDPESEQAGEAWIDANLGALFSRLKELGIDENTLVVFSPDHGRDGKGSLFGHNGTQVPMIVRWPAGIPAGLVSDEFVQNIDLVPTFFELAGAKVPDEYKIDGRSLVPLFKTGKAEKWRKHLYFEMGCARAVMTKEWKYIAVRYAREQLDGVKKSRPSNLPRAMSYISRSGIGTRGADHPGFFDPDQLYDLRSDPREMKNLVSNAGHSERLVEMRALLLDELRKIGRPFGEFIPGGDAVEPGQVDPQIATVKKIRIEGKKVILPPELAGQEETSTRRRKRKK